MASSANVERVNNTRWAQNSMASANASMRDKVSSLKASSEGENMRLFEFDMRGTPVIDKEIADSTFSLMKTNYGVAGHIFASWLVENSANITTMVNDVRKVMDKKFKFNSKERKWSAGVAAAYTTALITKELGLHDFDINANIKFMVDKVSHMRDEVKENVTGHDSLIADYLSEYHSTVLVIDGLPDKNGLLPTPRNKSITRITARYEPDTHKLFIAAKALRDYCVQRQFSYSSMRELTGARLTSKRLTTGSGVVSGAINALEFDTTINEFNLDEIAVRVTGEEHAT